MHTTHGPTTHSPSSISAPDPAAVGECSALSEPKTDNQPACPLTVRELLIADLVHRAFKNPQIAGVIGTSRQVTKNAIHRIFDKLGLWNRLELALWYEVHHCDGKCLTGENDGKS